MTHLTLKKEFSTQISHSQVKNCHRQLEIKNVHVLYKDSRKIPIKSVKMKISKNKKIMFFSHVPRITQPKNQVPRSQIPVCTVARSQTDSGHPFTVSGFFPSTYQSSKIRSAQKSIVVDLDSTSIEVIARNNLIYLDSTYSLALLIVTKQMKKYHSLLQNLYLGMKHVNFHFFILGKPRNHSDLTFSSNYDENKLISFRTSVNQGGSFSKCSIHFYGKGTCDYGM